jgi:hypothetical protein
VEDSSVLLYHTQLGCRFIVALNEEHEVSYGDGVEQCFVQESVPLMV